MDFLDDYLEHVNMNGPKELVSSIRKTATNIGNSYLSKFDYNSNRIGLLFGNIQSGKTGQVFGIASEAVDLGFPYFLMLTTDSKVLQEQTYERAKTDLSDFVVCNENEEEKFRNHGIMPVMIVVKKNSRVLKAWAERLRNTKMLKGNPIFIIDDEADAASLNTKVNSKIQNEQSAINEYLSQIRDDASSSIYLQVTGTPQALLLQSLDTNWHPLFTQYFNPGTGYLGGNFFFPSTKKAPNFIHFTDNRTERQSIHDVVLHHLVVSAQLLLSGGKVSNCLMHPGVKVATHNRLKDLVDTEMAWCADHHNEVEFIDALKSEYTVMQPQKSPKESFDDIKEKIFNILDQQNFQTIILNGSSSDNSTDYITGCNFIIGGTNLGRGVTFKQLHTFYYTRSSKSPQADTMWQHNRMFGYDRDPGLISMYCSRELYKLFAEINATNNSIVNQTKAGIKITIDYPDGLNPTRSNVLDKSLLDIHVGGRNYFPLKPKNNTFQDISELVKNFSDQDPAELVNLGLILELLKHFSAEESFKLHSYIEIISGIQKNNPLAQGRLLVRRNRDITRATGALLSPNDWKEGNKYTKEVVLTLYQVLGQLDKGWDGQPVWVPNIKLPSSRNFYLI